MTAEKASTIDGETTRLLREMALVDRILGLQAELAQEAVRQSPSRERFEEMEREVQAARQAVVEMRRSTTWRVGRMLLLPVRPFGRIVRRISR